MIKRWGVWVGLWVVVLVGVGSCQAGLPSGCPPNCLGVSLYKRNLSGMDLEGANLRNAALI